MRYIINLPPWERTLRLGVGASLGVCALLYLKGWSGGVPLVVELELAFACFARKEIRFHEMPGKSLPEDSLVRVNDQLALKVSTVVADVCAAGAADGAAAKAPARNFVPRWVRIDHAKGKWVGEYGL